MAGLRQLQAAEIHLKGGRWLSRDSALCTLVSLLCNTTLNSLASEISITGSTEILGLFQIEKRRSTMEGVSDLIMIFIQTVENLRWLI